LVAELQHRAWPWPREATERCRSLDARGARPVRGAACAMPTETATTNRPRHRPRSCWGRTSTGGEGGGGGGGVGGFGCVFWWGSGVVGGGGLGGGGGVFFGGGGATAVPERGTSGPRPAIGHAEPDADRRGHRMAEAAAVAAVAGCRAPSLLPEVSGHLMRVPRRGTGWSGRTGLIRSWPAPSGPQRTLWFR